MAEYLLSIDGGGTKTEFYLTDLQGIQVGSAITGSTNYKSVGRKVCFQNLKQGFSLLKENFFTEMDEIAYITMGISGCDSHKDQEILMEMTEALGIPKEKVQICNDAVLAYYAQTTGPGMVIVSGTGSIIIGIGHDGAMERAGGWGYNYSDGGSGYWIGMEILKKTLLYCDGCIGKAPIYDKMRTYYKAASFQELPYCITNISNNYEIAGLAALVTEEAEKGDDVAREILARGIAELASLVRTMASRLGLCREERCSIVFSGGVLKNPLYARMLKQEIKEMGICPQMNFFDQVNSPAYGGIVMALLNRKQKENSTKSDGINCV